MVAPKMEEVVGSPTKLYLGNAIVVVTPSTTPHELILVGDTHKEQNCVRPDFVG